MAFFKYLILCFVVFVGFSFSSEEKAERLQGVVRLLNQDCRSRSLTPDVARDLAYRKFEHRSSRAVKFVEITRADIFSSSSMPKGALESISQGANINACDENGRTLLHYVCAAQNMNLALEFLNYGARLLPSLNGVFPQDLICSDKLNIDASDVACIRNILVEEERRYVSEYQKMHMRRVGNKW